MHWEGYSIPSWMLSTKCSISAWPRTGSGESIGSLANDQLFKTIEVMKGPSQSRGNQTFMTIHAIWKPSGWVQHFCEQACSQSYCVTRSLLTLQGPCGYTRCWFSLQVGEETLRQNKKVKGKGITELQPTKSSGYCSFSIISGQTGEQVERPQCWTLVWSRLSK